MKKLDSRVNIVPVIAKADTITKTELSKFKAKVSQSCFLYKITILRATFVIMWLISCW